MEQRLKQRLVGAAVLVALAVIFIPMLLTGPVERYSSDMPLEIPPRPQLAELPPLPERGALQTLSERPASSTPVAVPPREQPATPVPRPVEPVPVVTERRPEPAPRPAPTPTPASAAKPATKPAATAEQAGWAVQVGSFGSSDNAQRLRQRLQQAGFTAFVEAPQLDSGRFYRVRVGPVGQRADAEALMARLQREQSLPGLVVAHP